MDNAPLEIHASKPRFRFLLALSILLGTLCAWLIFQLVIGKPFWQGLLITFFFTLLSVALAIKQKTESLLFKDGELIQKVYFIQRSIYLPSLVRAERYVTTIGKYPSPRLKLEDDRKNMLVVAPGDFTMKDLETIVKLISPYIFITSVEKNFMDLQFYVEQGMNVPRSSIWHIVRGTFLFILLPCIILTLLLIIWAITTKQPAFR